jgi:S-formylglutathione hydrolase FrmB
VTAPPTVLERLAMRSASLSWVVAAGLLVACASAAPPAAPPSPASLAVPACPAPIGAAISPARQPQPGCLCGRLRIPPGPSSSAATGNLVIAWYRPEEAARFRGGRFLPLELLPALFDRARVMTDVRPGEAEGVEYAIDYPGGDAVVLVVADFQHLFWETLLGGHGAGNFVGVTRAGGPVSAAIRHVDVTLEALPPDEPPPERCQGERFELVKVPAPEVAGTVGNETDRRLCVWLPASYRTSPRRRYGVVYLLPGFSGRDLSYLIGNQELRSTADALAREGVAEAILVGVDTSSRHGSTYFTDSAAGGAWESFAIRRLVQAIDGKFRTRAAGTGRALVGHSTGGFNAVSLAVRHPELYTVVGASAPDALDLESWLLDADGRVRARWLAWTRMEAAVWGAGQMVSYAAAWSTQGPPSAATFPFDLASGTVRADSWMSWTAHSPLRMLDDPERVAAVRRALARRLFITVGKKDEFGLHDPAQRFSARLTQLGIPHTFRSTEGGHGSDQQAGLTAALEFAVRTLAAP